MIKRNLAIIGTAGRDRSITMTNDMWSKMLSDAKSRVLLTDNLISGGAAWSDHLAVQLYLNHLVNNLTLHLPAPLENGRFVGGFGTSGGASNYYHKMFSNIIGIDTIKQIQLAIDNGAKTTCQPVARGYSAMFARNNIVAATSTHIIAYTFSSSDLPADGGTLNTWNKSNAEKIHVSIQNI